ncbi:carbohydrate-binding module family 1 protein [Sphaerobolus stellatus SS14]|uniref:Unplaced genomic scaffold SPHSTscaffold_599, whole genome shotgun sequence n=1 Tax=Sphaerobolus stellatus (strain SS14) TaxID=990650 RepID=A0A0C9TNL4_SPHS4|nr:carbohydrate-binding module family 1 protein [Sphaerobolus stellatus SS14]
MSPLCTHDYSRLPTSVRSEDDASVINHDMYSPSDNVISVGPYSDFARLQLQKSPMTSEGGDRGHSPTDDEDEEHGHPPDTPALFGSTVTASDIRGDHDYNRYHRRKPEIVSPTPTIMAATTSAPPQASYTNTVGVGSNCGIIGTIDYACGDGYECIPSWYSETASICNQIGQPAPTTASGAYVIIGLYVCQPRQPVPLLLHRALAYALFLFQQAAVTRDQPGPQLPPARVLIGRATITSTVTATGTAGYCPVPSISCSPGSTFTTTSQGACLNWPICVSPTSTTITSAPTSTSTVSAGYCPVSTSSCSAGSTSSTTSIGDCLNVPVCVSTTPTTVTTVAPTTTNPTAYCPVPSISCAASATLTTTTQGNCVNWPVCVPTQTPTQIKYGQCGGIGWSGPTVCASGSTCKVSNPYFSQCL